MAFCPIISSAIFNSLFNWSIDWWPGFAFFVGGCIQLVVVVGQIFVHNLMRPQWLLAKQLRSERDDSPWEENSEEEVPRRFETEAERSLSNTAVGSAPNLNSLDSETASH